MNTCECCSDFNVHQLQNHHTFLRQWVEIAWTAKNINFDLLPLFQLPFSAAGLFTFTTFTSSAKSDGQTGFGFELELRTFRKHKREEAVFMRYHTKRNIHQPLVFFRCGLRRPWNQRESDYSLNKLFFLLFLKQSIQGKNYTQIDWLLKLYLYFSG